MGKKNICPVGLICFDTKYIALLCILIALGLIYYIHNNNTPQSEPPIYDKPITYKPVEKKVEPQKIIIKEEPPVEKTKIIVRNQDSYLINKDYERVINPLLPPERRNHYIDPHSIQMVSPGVPINIPTRGYAGGVQQVGALYKENSDEPVILPLFGMPTYNGSNKWMYYTATDKFNQVKIPISNNNRECNLEYGCDELYDGDIINIPAYNGNFKVNKYHFDKPRYIPHIL